jgi:hypothetical protein
MKDLLYPIRLFHMSAASREVLIQPKKEQIFWKKAQRMVVESVKMKLSQLKTTTLLKFKKMSSVKGFQNET